MRVSEDLRALIGEFYLSGTPLGKRLEELLPRVEKLECGRVEVRGTGRVTRVEADRPQRVIEDPRLPPDWHPYEPDPDATP